MRIRGSLILLIVVGEIISGCQKQKSKTRYFTKLTGIISPYMSYKPRGEISGQDTLKWSYYRVKYDQQDRIAEIAYFKKNLKSNNSYYGTHKVKYSYKPASITRTYLDNNGNKSSMWRHYYMGGNIHQEKFELDDNGYKKILSLYDTSLNQIENSLASFTYQWETIDDKTFIQRQYKQDGTPNLLTEYFPFEVSRITIDDKGHLYRIENISEDGKLVTHQEAGFADVIFDFDEYGNEISWKFYDELGLPANRKPFRDTDYGYSKWVYSTEWIDERLGLINNFDEQYFDHNGDPVENNFGIHYVRYVIEPFSELASLEFYGLNEQKRIHPAQGFHRLVNTFDEDGNRVESIRYDTLGVPIE